MSKNYIPLDSLQLIGRSVRLEPLQHNHLMALLQAANVSRATYQFTLVPSDKPTMTAYINRALAARERREAVPFVTIDQASGTLIGTTRFMTMEYWTAPLDPSLIKTDGSPDVVEIGSTWISEPFQRTSINTEAKILMLTHAFEVWGVRRLTFKTDARNARSRANIERVGARFDGVLRAHMPAYDGGIRDTAFYSILENEWPTVKAALLEKLR